jgi:GNAT superfamily N-acetyltransferase
VISDTNISEVNPEDFLKVVQSKYKQNPYGISGFAFWKVEKQIHRAVTYQIADSHNNECLYAVINGKLVFYWTENAKPFLIPLDELEKFKLLSLHDRYGYVVEALTESHTINEYCPLSFSGYPKTNGVINDDFRIVTLDSNNSQVLSEIADIINESTTGSFTSESIEKWTEIRVFDPDLWIGAIDKKTNNMVGVGISTYNPSVKETDLDWFYIRKNFQGKHIGTMLVQETISRCIKKSREIRVAGIEDEFYIKCGFVKRDSWYYLTKIFTNVGWWD